MKALSVILIVSLFLGNGPIFGTPTTIPTSLDQLYNLIESGEGNWTFSPCEGAPQKPFLNWSQVNAIDLASSDDHGKSQLIIPASSVAQIVEKGGVKFPSKGTLNISENSLFTYLILEGVQGNLLACAAPGEKVTIYGSGVQNLFDKIATYISE